MKRVGLALVLACALVRGARAQDLSAELTCVPPESAVGEPVEWILEVEHPVRARIELGAEDPLASLTEIERLSWAVLSGPVREVQDLGAGKSRTRLRWRVLSLEGGERALPEIMVRDESGATAIASGGHLEVWSDLAESEDAPRAMAGLHDVEGKDALVGPFQVLAALAIVAALAVFALWWRARARRTRTIPAVTPSERLARLRAELPSTPEGSRAFAFELGLLLRLAVQERLGRDLVGLAEEEWLALARSCLPADALGELEGLLAALSRVKYAGEVPTRFRIEELCTTAASLLAKIDVLAKSEAGGQEPVTQEEAA